ncbi:MarR family winged helix-turn-helix transcriptional regulator [Zavarzinella formosa]|uniref:MarR family winged helix-turn-helix transcriptional regulator n=1 Tax=Zavarzinella formosa TaxID=360055 RepID=UPI0003815997|nr:MarR family winged helix-turn-helix transcriptional regulator [Zavarzinella formosa]
MSHSHSSPANSASTPTATPCLCTALRRASRAVTRIYDTEFRDTGLRVTQYALLSALSRSGEVRQSDLSEMTFLEETSLTRALAVLHQSDWVSIRPGADRREKRVSITEAGKAKLAQARPAWLKAQERLRQAMPEAVWATLFAVLPSVAQTASEI